MYKLALLILVFLGTANSCFAQYIRIGAWYTPSKAGTISGLALGPINSGLIDSVDQTINGISVEIGIGFPASAFMPINPYYDPRDYSMSLQEHIDHRLRDRSVTVNGLAAAGIGSIGLGIVNGLHASCGFDFLAYINGLSVSPFAMMGIQRGVRVGIYNAITITNGLLAGAINWNIEVHGTIVGGINQSKKVHGIQIGFYNETKELQGVQLGLINVSDDRWLPVINWGF